MGIMYSSLHNAVLAQYGSIAALSRDWGVCFSKAYRICVGRQMPTLKDAVELSNLLLLDLQDILPL